MRAMSQENVEIVKAQLRGFSGEGLDAFLAFFDEDIEYLPVGEAATLRGFDAVRRYFENWVETWEEFRAEPTEFLDSGDCVIAGEALRGRGNLSGVEVAMEFGPYRCSAMARSSAATSTWIATKPPGCGRRASAQKSPP